MKLRQGLVLVLAVTAGVALIAAKILWAFTAWYEWPALAIAGLSLMALEHVADDDADLGDRPFHDGTDG
jgi:hypothetical protein